MTSQPEHQSGLLSDEEMWMERVLLSALYQVCHVRGWTYTKQLLEILQRGIEGTIEPLQIPNEVDRLRAAWQNRSTS